jgi:hypothetical protein
MARGTGTRKDNCAQPRSASADAPAEQTVLPPWPSHKKPLAPGDRVVYYRASEKDARPGFTPHRKGAVAELSADEKGILVTIDDEDGTKTRVRLGQTAKMNRDGSNPGLPWAHYPNGQEAKEDEQCQEWVTSSARWDFRGHQCTFKAKADSLYCGRHQKIHPGA